MIGASRTHRHVSLEGSTIKGFNLDQLLEGMLKASDRISDLNFSAGAAPQVEVDGELRAVKFPYLDKLMPFQTEIVAMHLLKHDPAKVKTLVETGATDVSYAIPGKTLLVASYVFNGSWNATYALLIAASTLIDHFAAIRIDRAESQTTRKLFLLGFRFPDNFRRPHCAVNVSEFWRRWHISLSSWLRVSLYISLGGSRG